MRQKAEAKSMRQQGLPVLHVFSLDENSIESESIKARIQQSSAKENVELRLMNGSGAYQDLGSDAALALRGKIQALAETTDAVRDNFLMADVFHGTQSGYTDSAEKNSGLVSPKDNTGELLVYAQIQHLANQYPGRAIQYHLVLNHQATNRMPPLMEFFMRYPGLLPRGTTLNLLSPEGKPLYSISGSGSVNAHYPQACRELFTLALMQENKNRKKRKPPNTQSIQEGIPSLYPCNYGQYAALSDEIAIYLRRLISQVLMPEETKGLREVFESEEFHEAEVQLESGLLPPPEEEENATQIDTNGFSPPQASSSMVQQGSNSAPVASDGDEAINQLAASFFEGLIGAESKKTWGALFDYVRLYCSPSSLDRNELQTAMNNFKAAWDKLKQEMDSLPNEADKENAGHLMKAMLATLLSKDFLAMSSNQERASFAQKRVSLALMPLNGNAPSMQPIKSALMTFLAAVDMLFNVLTLGAYALILDKAKKPFLFERENKTLFFKQKAKESVKKFSQSLPSRTRPEE